MLKTEKGEGNEADMQQKQKSDGDRNKSEFQVIFWF